MSQRLESSRFFIETLVLAALTQSALLYAMPALAPGMKGVAAVLLNVVLLVLLAGPAVFWRYIANKQRSARAQGKRHHSDVRAAIRMTAAAQLAGLALTAVGVVWLHQVNETAAKARFERFAERIESEVQRRFARSADGVNGLAGLYAASKSVERGEFRAYVDLLNVAVEFPGLHGFGFIQRVMREDLDRFVAVERTDGAPDFTVRSSGDANDLYVVKFIEPLSNNRAVWGFDVGSDHVRRVAIERAVSTGMPALTQRITQALDGKTQGTGFWYLRPVYRNGSSPTTPQQRQAALVGLLYSRMVVAEVMAGVTKVADQLLDFELFDGFETTNSNILFDSVQYLNKVHGNVNAAHRTGKLFELSRELAVGGRTLTLRVSTAPAFEADVARDTGPAWFGTGGALLSFLLAQTVWLLASGRARARAMAQRLTADLERLAKVVQHTSNAVIITDRDLRITWVNAGFTRISGYPLDEAAGRTPGELLGSGKTDPAALETLRQAAGAGEACRVQVLNRAKNGTEYWIDIDVQPMHDEAGNLSGFMEIGVDITERMLAKKKLREMAHRLELAVEGSNDGLFHMTDAATGDEWWSRKFYELLGYVPGELKPCFDTFQSLLHPDHVEKTRQAAQDAMSGRKPYDVEYLVRTKAGDYRWFRGRAKVTFNASGVATQMAGSMQDIHERKQAEHKIIESERFLRTVADGLPGRVAYWTNEQRCVIANQESVEWFARRPEEVVGLSMRELLREEVFAAAEPFVLGALRGERQAFERAERSADASVRHKWVQYVPDMVDGVVKGFFVLVSDITERKRGEDLLREATQRAEQASIAKSQFLANMSHEIRTPMHAVLGMLKLLKNTTLLGHQLDYVTKTEGAARLLLGLLNDILDFSKLEARKMALDLRPFHTERLLRDLSVILSANGKSDAVEVLFDIDPTVPECVIGDDLRLQQVLINLCCNAMKFTEQGEVVLRVRVAERCNHAVLLEFSVRDSGIGIAPQDQELIFAMFSQAEASTTRRYGGTGLGLAICQRLVGMMGGKLTLESAPGLGSNFSFLVELAISPVLADEPVLLPCTQAPSLQALVLDDNAVARELLVGMARTLGWQADAAASGDEAIALLRAKLGTATAYQAVFVDFGMAGWETAMRVRRQLGAAESLLVIMMACTPGLDALQQQGGADTGALLNGLLTKPATAAMLFDAVAGARGAGAQRGLPRRPEPGNPTRLTGMRVLVVEDHPLNQQLVQKMLSDEGAEVKLTSNGEEAVAAVIHAEPPFDAVLMDIQMPVMDGYTATAEIRRQMQGRAPPIIATTANASAADREACMAAGMNDHVGKPFDRAQLVAALTRRIGTEVPAAARIALPIQEMPAQLLDQAAQNEIDWRGALHRLAGDAEEYLSMLEVFRDSLDDMPEQLALKLRQGRRLDASRAIHTLKGLAATLGIKRLAAHAALAESKLSDAGNQSQDETLVAGLRTAIAGTVEDLRQIEARLREIIHPPEPSAATRLDRAAQIQTLDSLAQLLRVADMRALDVHARLRHGQTALSADSMQGLKQAMAVLDFPHALVHCEALKRELKADFVHD